MLLGGEATGGQGGYDEQRHSPIIEPAAARSGRATDERGDHVEGLARLKGRPGQGLISFQSPSEMTSTLPSTTVMAVLSSMA
ncbi:hypothetical protein Misp05_46770 [Micromonospora sp. NBRC 107095]|nr:hypothetical protein Misp05_46770 [Micromonospora sp. NBRC 107095]